MRGHVARATYEFITTKQGQLERRNRLIERLVLLVNLIGWAVGAALSSAFLSKRSFGNYRCVGSASGRTVRRAYGEWGHACAMQECL
jgi:hypothetical protein